MVLTRAISSGIPSTHRRLLFQRRYWWMQLAPVMLFKPGHDWRDDVYLGRLVFGLSPRRYAGTYSAPHRRRSAGADFGCPLTASSPAAGMRGPERQERVHGDERSRTGTRRNRWLSTGVPPFGLGVAPNALSRDPDDQLPSVVE